LFLTPASQLAIVGAGSNTILRIVSKGDKASPSAVGKELGYLALQTATIIAAQTAWQTVVKNRLLNPINKAFAAVAIPLVIGGVVSYVIDEDEGLENFFYAVDVYSDPEISQDTKNTMVLSDLKTIFDFYSGGGQNRKEGLFQYEN
jgi:hypothetical protein